MKTARTTTLNLLALNLLALTLFTTAPASVGSILLDNPSTYNAGVGSTFGSALRLNGFYFTMGGTAYTLDKASIAIGANSAFPTAFTMNLWQLNAADTKPANGSTPLLSEVFTGVSVTTTPTLYAFDPTAQWLLQANTRYALTWEANPAGQFGFQWKGTNPSVTWDGHSIVTPGTSLRSEDGGASFIAGANQGYGLLLEGTVYNPSAVPEPSTDALLCISLGVMWYVRKKMTKCAG